MKFVLIGLVAVVLLAGSFTGLTIVGVIPDVLGVRQMVAGPLGLAVETAEEQPDPNVRVYGPIPVFKAMPQMAVPVINDGRTQAQLMLGLRFHIEPGSEVELQRAMPRLQDAILTGLMDALPRIYKQTGRLDLRSIKGRLNALIREQVGSDVVHDVLIDIAYLR